MAEGNTVSDLIERIRAEGQLTRNSGTNSIKSVNVTLKTFQPVLEAIRGSMFIANIELASIRHLLAAANDMTAEQLEDMRRKAQLEVTPSEPKQDNGVQPNTNNGPTPAATDPNLASLGMLSTAIAGSLGATLGILAGQFKAVKAFGKMFTPSSLAKNIKGVRLAIAMNLELFKQTMTEKITAVRTAVTNGLQRVKTFLSIGEESKLGKAIASFKSFFAPITELFSSAAKTLGSLTGGGQGGGVITKIGEIAGRIGSYFKTIGALVGRVAGIVGKIFAPIAVVITLFDTVKGAIDGYAEGGVLGGLEGAINGFFTSLITKPLDLIKDAVAWVIGKLGFDESSEALKSFSFTELFTNITGAIFDGVKATVNWVGKLFTDPVGAISALWAGVYGEEGIFNTLLWKPISKGINWIMEKFGWKEEGAPDFDLFTFVTDTWDKVVAKVKTGFEAFGDWVSSIPDRIAYTAQEMYINIKSKLEAGFLMFGDWFSSIPARIKLAAFETIRSVPGGSLLIDDDDVASAQAQVNSNSSDLEARLQAIETRRLEQLAELEKNATGNTNVVAPTTINNGGSTTNNVNNYYTSTGASASLDPALAQ
jgi:hypothetical protein